MSKMFYNAYGQLVNNQITEEFSNIYETGNIEQFSNETKELSQEEITQQEEKSVQEIPKLKDQDFLAMNGNLVLDGVVKATDFLKSDGSKVKEVAILKNNYILPKDIKYTAGGKLETVELKSNSVNAESLKTRKVEIAGPLHLYDKTTKTDDGDPYRIEKVRTAPNKNQLRVILHDDPDESMAIWGNSCANGKCADDSRAKEAHKFDVQGNADHKGTIKCKKLCIGNVCLEEKNGELVLNNNLRVNKQLHVHGGSWYHGVTSFKNQKKDAWSHLNWSDGNVYLRGDVKLDGYGGTGKNLNVAGRGYYGDLVNAKGLVFDRERPHINTDGALYRHGGQIYFNNDDNIYISQNGKIHGNIGNNTIKSLVKTPNQYIFHRNSARHGDDIKGGFENMAVGFQHARAMCDSMKLCGGILQNQKTGRFWLKTTKARDEVNKNKWSEKSSNWHFWVKN